MITIPVELDRQVTAWFGERGQQWLAGLPATVAELASRWRLRVPLGEPLPGGTHALVVPVVRADGEPAALKVPVVDDENFAEPLALRAYGGDGAVQLYEHDVESGAMLMELARPGTPMSLHNDRDAATAVLCDLLRRLRREVPASLAGALPWAAPGALPAVRDLAASWAVAFPTAQRELHLPGMDAVVDAAAALAAGYAAEPDGPELLINRDAHLDNILAAEREPWLLIDPKPLRGEAAFEGGHPVLTLLPGSQFTAAPPSAELPASSGRSAPSAGSVSSARSASSAPPAVLRLPAPPADGTAGIPPAGAGGGHRVDLPRVPPGVEVPRVPSAAQTAAVPSAADATPVPTAADAARVVAAIADGLRVPRERVRGWALLRAVENALWAARLGEDPAPDIAQATALFAASAG